MATIQRNESVTICDECDKDIYSRGVMCSLCENVDVCRYHSVRLDVGGIFGEFESYGQLGMIICAACFYDDSPITLRKIFIELFKKEEFSAWKDQWEKIYWKNDPYAKLVGETKNE